MLEKIGRIGSVRKAAIQMNMSYSKAHSMIVRMEKEIGEQSA
ncbi:MAG: LysR family transcriptional regulator [Elusimicrobiota bacterium]